jgi:hypothetical protein
MIKKLLSLIAIVTLLVSCQFTETMVLQEDGSGTLSISMDLKEMMAFGDIANDSSMVKTDTIVRLKDMMREKKDSIAALPQAQQDRLKSIENFNFRTVIDPEEGAMFFDVFTDFKSVSEANDMMSAFEEGGNFFQSSGSDTTLNTDPKSSGAIGVSYLYDDGKFIRDAFIKNKEIYKTQIDSMKSAESFMSSMMYKLKYTFPRRIVKASKEDVRLTMDGKTIEIEVRMLDYLKNPDLLDLEVELEN